MSVTDLQKYLVEIKALFSKKIQNAQQHFLPQLLTLFGKAKENKEAIIKGIIPLGIISLGFYTCISSHNMVFSNISDIFTISDEIRNHYAEKPDYWGLSTQTAIQANYIPPKFIKDGKIIISSGNEIFIGDGAKADTIMPRATSFDIVLPQLNKAQCIAHAEAAISSENQVKLLSISIINSLGFYRFEWGNEKYKLPIAKFASKDVCSDFENTLIWSIK